MPKGELKTERTGGRVRTDLPSLVSETPTSSLEVNRLFSSVCARALGIWGSHRRRGETSGSPVRMGRGEVHKSDPSALFLLRKVHTLMLGPRSDARRTKDGRPEWKGENVGRAD